MRSLQRSRLQGTHPEGIHFGNYSKYKTFSVENLRLMTLGTSGSFGATPNEKFTAPNKTKFALVGLENRHFRKFL